MSTRPSADRPRIADCGHSIITVDDSEEGRVWWEDDQRHVPTVVVRMTPWCADRRAQILTDWSAISDMMDEGEERSDRRFAALLMHAACAAEGKAEEAEAACKRILAHLDGVPRLAEQQPQQRLRAGHRKLADPIDRRSRGCQPVRQIRRVTPRQHHWHDPAPARLLVLIQLVADQPRFPLRPRALIGRGVPLRPPLIPRRCNHQHKPALPQLPAHPQRPIPRLLRRRKIKSRVHPIRPQKTPKNPHPAHMLSVVTRVRHENRSRPLTPTRHAHKLTRIPQSDRRPVSRDRPELRFQHRCDASVLGITRAVPCPAWPSASS
jgi:hypothetical protein